MIGGERASGGFGKENLKLGSYHRVKEVGRKNYLNHSGYDLHLFQELESALYERSSLCVEAKFVDESLYVVFLGLLGKIRNTPKE